MRDTRFSAKIRLGLTSGLVAVLIFSTTPWLAQPGIRSRTVLAQTTNASEALLSQLRFNISRTVLSHGRVENARQQTPINPNGLRDVQGFGDPTKGTPGLLTAIATPSLAWQPDALHITMGWDPNFSKELLGIGPAATNPVTMAALGIPSCFTMVVADGIAPAFPPVKDGIPTAVRWDSTGPRIGQGNLYASVSIPAAGIVAGMELRTEEELAAYTANSIIWEAPPFGQVVQDTTLMQFGTKKITGHPLDLTDPANPVMGEGQSAVVEITETLHVEIEVLGIEKNHDGSFRLCAIANMFGNSLEPVTSFWFRWGFDGQTVDLVGDIPGTNLVTIPHIPASEENQLGELYVVASCNGGLLTKNPFTAEPLDAPPMVFVRKSIGLLTFVSGGCTLEDDQSVKMTPFGQCPEAEAMIIEMERVGAAGAGNENVWMRTTPARGEVEFKRAEDAANLTITENSCTFRETGPAGEASSNTVTWTIPPERMSDDGKPVPVITYGIQEHATDGLTPEERVNRGVAKCRYQGQISVTSNPFADINTWGFFQSDSAHGNRQMSGGVATKNKDRLLAPVGFDIDRSGFSGLPHESFVVMVIDFYPWKGESFSITIRWRYEYSRRETLATVTRDGREIEAQKGMEVIAADRVRTQANCKLALSITNGKGLAFATLGVAESADFEIRLLALGKPNRFEFAVNSGQIRSEVFGERGSTQFRINSPTAIASVNGTVFTTGYNPQEQASTVGVEQGAVLVTPTNTALPAVTVNAGQQVKVTANQVSPIAAYSASRSRGVMGNLIYIGIGAALLILILISMIIVTRSKRPPVPGQDGMPARRPGTVAVPPLATALQSPPVTPAVCNKCGAPLKPGKAFCTACGTPQSPTSVATSGTGSPTGATGGASRGASPLTRTCSNPQCRQPLVPGKGFCTKCGTRVL